MRTRLRRLFLAVALSVALSGGGCFSPAVPECAFVCGAAQPVCPPDMTCGSDDHCHPAGEAATCGVVTVVDGGKIDAAITVDAPVGADGPLVDAAPTVDGKPADAPVGADARPIDAAVTVDARPIDAPPVADAATVDAPNCGQICADDRTCGSTSGCECGVCGDALWCTENCSFAVCEASRCCLPEGSTCDPGAGQCCSGLTCLTLCVVL